MKLTVLSSFPPTQSGIATFAHHMLRALREADETMELHKIPVVAPGDPPSDDSLPLLAVIRRDVPEDYSAAAMAVNMSDCDALLIEHEFAQFGGNRGDCILKTITETAKPVFLVAHTVPSGEDARHLEIKTAFFLAIKDRIAGITVFSRQAYDWLAALGYPGEKLVVIPHAVPDFDTSLDTASIRRELGLPVNRPILFGFGFVHPDKGTVYAVRAMETVKNRGNRTLFVYAGTSLPGVPESAACVADIKKEIAGRHLEDCVTFMESYVSDAKVAALIAAADVGIVPYAYKSYTASGPLSFLIGAGKPIIVTPFTYAAGTLAPDEACFVPFRNEDAIAEAVIKLTTDPAEVIRLRSAVAKKRATLTWDVIGRRYHEFFSRRLGTFTFD